MPFWELIFSWRCLLGGYLWVRAGPGTSGDAFGGRRSELCHADPWFGNFRSLSTDHQSQCPFIKALEDEGYSIVSLWGFDHSEKNNKRLRAEARKPKASTLLPKRTQPQWLKPWEPKPWTHRNIPNAGSPQLVKSKSPKDPGPQKST